MKKLVIIFGILAFVAACSTKAQEDLGIQKKAPDETQIKTNPSLTLPPDFDTTPVSVRSGG
ncbi:MAG: DUF3035 domain-containing protein [Lactobacillaceae bacterium]|jgi:hypothetical protein|nr:DUF3035 domain-containing protein [Lactobacillaceae bacterium]